MSGPQENPTAPPEHKPADAPSTGGNTSNDISPPPPPPPPNPPANGSAAGVNPSPKADEAQAVNGKRDVRVLYVALTWTGSVGVDRKRKRKPKVIFDPGAPR